MSGSRKSNMLTHIRFRVTSKITVPDYLKTGTPADGDHAVKRHSSCESNEGQPVSVGSIAQCYWELARNVT